ncbi:MAG: HDOD domain-containing protein [Planctomycetota bacterium]|jgi:HD-like signal output (HDOD) protein
MSTIAVKPSLEDVLSNSQIPALPTSAMMLLELSQDPNKGPSDYARPIESDVGLMGQVLRFVNSAYFGFSREISSVQQALTLVGIRTIKNFALWSAVFSIVPNPKLGPFDLRRLWQDSLRRALFARTLGRDLKLPNAEELFAAALLQDMAIPFLLKALPRQYEHLLERQGKENQRLSSLEREAFGWDHAQAAAHLCRQWDLPEDFANLIERHPSLNELMAGSKPQIAAACVGLASLLPACKDASWEEEQEFRAWFDRINKNHQVSLSDLMAKVDEAMEGFAPVMHLPIPEKSLSAFIAATDS